jgi:hypothetical protein
MVFLNSNKEHINKFHDIKERYSLGNYNEFNIFTSISEQYRKENLHSDILKLIFDPNTQRIGNYKYLKAFIEFISDTLKINIELDYKSVKVEREKDRIDVFIHDENKVGIIIENKINNAGDRENQIGKYYRGSIDKDIDVKAIVYLTLSSEKKLDRDYSIKDLGDKKAIENILIELPFINKIGENSFVDSVLNKCVLIAENELSENNISVVKKHDKELSKVYLSEYAILLKHLGGNFMLADLREKALYDIFKDEKASEDFRVLGDMWNNLENMHRNVFKEYFQKELNFKIHPGSPEGYWVYKTVKTDVNIGFSSSDSAFGFVYTPNTGKINSDNKKTFKKILGDEQLGTYLKEDKVCQEDSWVYRIIDYEKINSFDDLKELTETLEGIIKNEKHI